MLKKLISVLAAAALFAGCMTGCAMDGGKYDAVKQAQAAVMTLSSGRLMVTAGYEKNTKSDRIVTEFIFQKLESGAYAYCQTQYDRNNKPVYCEYSDGTKTEQWLIGKGWGEMTGVLYSAESPHRYMKLLSTAYERKTVSSISMTQEDANKRYDMVLNPTRLNETVYTDGDAEALEESVSVLVGEDGGLLCYNDEARMKDHMMGEEIKYTLEIQLNQQNTVAEIQRPDLRDDYMK